jgi:hypothetical protein
MPLATPIFMLWKRGHLLPDLREIFFTQDLLAFEILCQHSLTANISLVPFNPNWHDQKLKSHLLNLTIFYTVVCHNMKLPISLFIQFMPGPSQQGSHIQRACLIL